jgi:hypothetical protein
MNQRWIKSGQCKVCTYHSKNEYMKLTELFSLTNFPLVSSFGTRERGQGVRGCTDLRGGQGVRGCPDLGNGQGVRGCPVKTINEHLKNIYSSGELNENSTIWKFRIVQTEGQREVQRALSVPTQPNVLPL